MLHALYPSTVRIALPPAMSRRPGLLSAWLVGASLALPAAAGAGEPYLVKDINPGPGGSFAHDGPFFPVITLGQDIIFPAYDGSRRIELWVTDGTEKGTVPFRERVEQPPDWRTQHATTETIQQTQLLVIGDLLYFVADDGTHGGELWVSDGSARGTRLVSDIRPGSEGSDPRDLTAAGDRLFFTAEKEGDRRQLWVAGEAGEGARRLSDFVFDGAVPRLATLGRQVFFTAGDEAHGHELWVSDGTAEGTRLVSDIRPGSGGSQAHWRTAVGERLFFVADDGTHGYELWVSDGTAEGTRLVSDIRPGSGGSYPGTLTAVGERLFFLADDGIHGRELWVSDGSAGGTRLVSDIRPGPEGLALYNPRNLAVAGDRLFFVTVDARPEPEYKLWATDGTARGTQAVASAVTSAAGGGFYLLTAAGERVFFFRDGHKYYNFARELWVSDGTLDGTWLVTDVTDLLPDTVGFSIDRRPAAVGQWVFFYVLREVQRFAGLSLLADWSLWTTDGTPAGTRQVANVGSSYVRNCCEGGGGLVPPRPLYHRGALYFYARDDLHGWELWAVESEGEPWHLPPDPEPEPLRFLRGDCNGDGEVAGSVTDAVFLLNHNFSGGPAPPCLAACDANGDGEVTGQVTDAVYLLQFSFLGGPAPPAPFPACGPGPLASDAALGCGRAPAGCE
jgi:ELWxxDGT repeat protein